MRRAQALNPMKAILVIAGAAAAAFYFCLDPAQHAWMPKCMVHTLTGLQCPGCGSQRLLHALLHGDLAAAWHANAFLLLALPYLALMLIADLWSRRLPKLHRAVNSVAAITILCIAIALWTFLRNFVGC